LEGVPLLRHLQEQALVVRHPLVLVVGALEAVLQLLLVVGALEAVVVLEQALEGLPLLHHLPAEVLAVRYPLALEVVAVLEVAVTVVVEEEALELPHRPLSRLPLLELLHPFNRVVLVVTR
jgi:hypothetical protein